MTEQIVFNPISVLTSSKKLIKTEHSSPMNLLDGIFDKDSLKFFMILKRFH